MKLNIFLSTSIFIILLLASCNKKEEKQHVIEPTSPLEEVDTTYMKCSFLREIRNYVTEHDPCNVFIIMPTYEYQLKPNAHESDYEFLSDIDNEIFYINEAYKNSFDGGEFSILSIYPHRYIKIGEKYVFMHSRDDKLYDQEKLKSIIHRIDYKGFNYDSAPKFLIVYDKIDSCKAITPQFRKDNYKCFDLLFRSRIKFTAPDI